MKQVVRWFSLTNAGIGTDFKVPESSIYYIEGNISTTNDYDETVEALTFGVLKGGQPSIQGSITINKLESKFIRLPMGYVTSDDVLFFDVPPNMSAIIEIYREI